MKDIGHKITTFRHAEAVSILRLHPRTLAKVRRGDTPKPDVLAVSRAAGLLAAKKTPEWIPYCHPIPLEQVSIDYELFEDRVEIRVGVKALWKTGVEMEALTAASAVALNLYDMLKPIDKDMEILSTRLIRKKGGKSDYQTRAPRGLKAAVLVTSDGTFAGKREDRSGRLLKEKLGEMGVEKIDYKILPDETEAIRNQLLAWCEAGKDLVITTGGTGMGPRDVTVEATEAVLDRPMPAVMQTIRQYGQLRTPFAMLSRGMAGMRGKTLILNLPGSSRGAAESMEAVFPALFHVYPMLKGGGH